MGQEVILAYRLLSTPVFKYLTQLCRSQFVEYFRSQREGEPDVVFAGGVSALSPPYAIDIHDIRPKVAVLVLKLLSSEAENQLGNDASCASLASCADLDIWIHHTISTLLNSLRVGRVTEGEWNTWQERLPLPDTAEFQQVQRVDYLDFRDFLFSEEQPNQEELVSLKPTHLKSIIQELEKCGPKQLTSEQVSDSTKVGDSIPHAASARAVSKTPQRRVFLLKRSLQDEDALGFLFRPMSFEKRARKVATLPQVKENMTCEEYITFVHSAFNDDRVNGENRGNWKEGIIDRKFLNIPVFRWYPGSKIV